MLGELRDLESIQIALMAAETGHLVMGTVHSTTAVGAVSRILDVFPANQQPQIRLQLSQSIRMVFAQRLLQGVKPKSRVLTYEILTGTTGVQNLIRSSEMEQIANLINAGRAHGMISYAQCKRDLVARGLIPQES
jgi:twitching motility protein PilT